MKNIILVLGLFFVGSGLSAQKLTVDRVVAQVGNSSILYSDVEQAARELTEQYKAQGVSPQREVFYEALEGLMERKLAYSQAQIDSLTIDETAAANDAVELLRAQTADAGGVRQLEQKTNMTVYDIEKHLKQQMREMYLAETMQRSVIDVDKVKMTPGEVELFFARFPSDSIPMVPEQYMYAQITRFPQNMKEAKERVRERLMGMREQVISGSAKFETLARLYSEDNSGADATASKGGLLPPITLEQMDPAWQAAVERLRPGQISEVVETEYGLQIIQFVERDGERYILRYIPMRPKYTTAELAVGAKFLDSLATEIRGGKISFEEAARKYSDDTATRQNGGVATNTELLSVTQGGRASGSQMQFKFRKEDFTYNLIDYHAISRMKVGEVGDSYSARDIRGNELSKIIKLVAIYPTHEANMADDYLVLEQAALAAKREKTYVDWLEKTIAATHVRVDPAYRDPEKWQNKAWLK